MRRRRFPLAVLLALSALAVMAALAVTPGSAKPDRTDGFAEPGDIVAAEGAFQHLRTAKGPRAAIRATAQADAQTYAPLPARVADYLKRPGEPALPPAWQPQRIFMSCDGSYAVAAGAWQQSATKAQPVTGWPVTGWYATVWHRQKDGSYKWVLDLGDTLAAALPEPEMIAGSVADCPERRARKVAGAGGHARPAAIDYTEWHADDATLTWSATSGPGGAAGMIVQLKQNGALHEVLRIGRTPAPR